MISERDHTYPDFKVSNVGGQDCSRGPRAIGREMHGFAAQSVSYLPKHYRRWDAAHADHDRRPRSAHRFLKCPAAAGSSTGWCQKSGTSATLISPTRRNRIVDFRNQPARPELQHSGSSRYAFERTTGRICSRCPNSPSGFRIAPRITESWGFCLSHKQLLALKEGEYEVRIDSTLEADP